MRTAKSVVAIAALGIMRLAVQRHAVSINICRGSLHGARIVGVGQINGRCNALADVSWQPGCPAASVGGRGTAAASLLPFEATAAIDSFRDYVGHSWPIPNRGSPLTKPS